MNSKKEEVVLILGGTKGIGKAIYNALATLEQVRHIIITYVHDAKGATHCVEELRNQGKEGTALQVDITEPTAPQQLMAQLKSLQLTPTYVIFNANITNRTPLAEISAEAWGEVFQANVHFPVMFIKELLPYMVPGGLFAFTGSLMGIYPHSVSLAYGVTKNAVHALVQNLVKELEPYQHRVVGVAPGFVDTEWQKGKPQAIRENIERKIALHRFAEPSEVGALFSTLLENKYFNGDIITISGGYSYK